MGNNATKDKDSCPLLAERKDLTKFHYSNEKIINQTTKPQSQISYDQFETQSSSQFSEKSTTPSIVNPSQIDICKPEIVESMFLKNLKNLKSKLTSSSNNNKSIDLKQYQNKYSIREWDDMVALISTAEKIITEKDTMTDSIISSIQTNFMSQPQVQQFLEPLKPSTQIEYLAIQISQIDSIFDRLNQVRQAILTKPENQNFRLPFQSVYELLNIDQSSFDQFIVNLTHKMYLNPLKNLIETDKKCKQISEKIKQMFNKVFDDMRKNLKAAANDSINRILTNLEEIQSTDLSHLLQDNNFTLSLTSKIMFQKIRNKLPFLLNSLICYQKNIKMYLESTEIPEHFFKGTFNLKENITISLNPRTLKENIELGLLTQISQSIDKEIINLSIGQLQNEKIKPQVNNNQSADKLKQQNENSDRNLNELFQNTAVVNVMNQICSKDPSWKVTFISLAEKNDLINELLILKEQTFLSLFHSNNYFENCMSLKTIKHSIVEAQYFNQNQIKLYIQLPAGKERIGLHRYLSNIIIEFILGQDYQNNSVNKNRQILLNQKRVLALSSLIVTILYLNKQLKKTFLKMTIHTFKQLCFEMTNNLNQSFNQPRSIYLKIKELVLKLSREDVLKILERKVEIQRSTISGKLIKIIFNDNSNQNINIQDSQIDMKQFEYLSLGEDKTQNKSRLFLSDLVDRIIISEVQPNQTDEHTALFIKKIKIISSQEGTTTIEQAKYNLFISLLSLSSKISGTFESFIQS